MAIFALRSPHRPNPVGVSTVAIIGLDVDDGRVVVRGLDCLNHTPVLDLKRG